VLEIAETALRDGQLARHFDRTPDTKQILWNFPPDSNFERKYDETSTTPICELLFVASLNERIPTTVWR
jgi:hypothetical protein